MKAVHRRPRASREEGTMTVWTGDAAAQSKPLPLMPSCPTSRIDVHQTQRHVLDALQGRAGNDVTPTLEQ